MSTPTLDDIEGKMAEFVKALSSKDIESLVSMAQREDEEQPKTIAERSVNDKGRSRLLSCVHNWGRPCFEKINKKWKKRIQASEGTTQEEEMNLFITILVVTLAWKITNALIVAHDKKVEQRRKEGPNSTQPEWDLPYEVYPGGEEAVRLGS